MGTNACVFDTLRVLNFSGISASYAAVGSAFSHQVRILCFTNNTNGDMLVSFDRVNDILFIPAGGFKLFDITTNKADNNSGFVVTPSNIVYVKQSTAPTSGDFYVECLYARGE